MTNTYSKDFKRKICKLIVEQKRSTKLTALESSIPVKTVEKWITAYNKDPRCFNYDYVSPETQIKDLKKEIFDLKKENELLKIKMFKLKKSNKKDIN